MWVWLYTELREASGESEWVWLGACCEKLVEARSSMRKANGSWERNGRQEQRAYMDVSLASDCKSSLGKKRRKREKKWEVTFLYHTHEPRRGEGGGTDSSPVDHDIHRLHSSKGRGLSEALGRLLEVDNGVPEAHQSTVAW